MANVFQSVNTAKPRRSLFNLSYEKKLTCDFAWMYPVMCDETVPGDTFKIGCSAVIRFNPLVAPIMHEVTAKAYYFFVPYRILDNDWEEIITGGVRGTSTKTPPVCSVCPPSPLGTLWDYLGYPTDINPINYSLAPIKPIDYPRRAYYYIYAHYFRDENFNDPNSYSVDPAVYWIKPDLMPNPDAFKAGMSYGSAWTLQSGSWDRDYFTTALRSQQRGTQPALPISGNLPVNYSLVPGTIAQNQVMLNAQGGVGGSTPALFSQLNPAILGAPSTGSGPYSLLSNMQAIDLSSALANHSFVNLGNATTFNVADIRTAVQIQKWLERNSRSGVRYTEFLRAHFAVAPRDERLDRPEYIGGARMRLITSEVLQTSATSSVSPQANMAGHGISVGGSFIGTYRVTEFGLIMGILVIRPKPAYEDRLDRQWIKPTRYDFFFPEFQTLSEQGIYNAELRYRLAVSDTGIFGFQGRYSEMRFKHDLVCGLFRQSAPQNLSFWHMARHWNASTVVPYNSAFLYTDGFNTTTGAKRVLAVPSQPTFLVNWCNHIKAVRPIPFESDPGYLDHY
jgi:hypothetical protein